MRRSSQINQFRQFLLAAVAVGGVSICAAQDVGRVLSATPVMQAVGTPRQVCTTEQIAVQPQKSGAGAAIGAIAGGAIGNAMGGRGAGRAAATMIGVIGGAIVGDRVEGEPAVQMHDVQRCTSQTFYENRPVAYNVVYEFGGKQYSVQMPTDPGATIQLQVSVVGASPPAAEYAQPTYAPPMYAAPPVVVVTQPAYPVYYGRSYYPPIRLNLGYGHWAGRHDRGEHRTHGHWR